MMSIPTLSELSAEYFASRSLRLSTVYSYNQSIRVALRLMGDRPIDSYLAEDISGFRQRLLREGRSEHTAARILREISVMFQFARNERHYIETNVVEDLKFRPSLHGAEPFTEQELNAFFDYAWEHKRPVYYQAMFLLLTGCRSHESCTFMLEQVRPDAEELDCRSEQSGRLESVPVTPVLRAFLIEIPPYDDPYAFHFRSVHGLYRAVKSVIRKCGARDNLAVQSFRETLGSRSREAGVKRNIMRILVGGTYSQKALQKFPHREAQRKERRLHALSIVHTHLVRGLHPRIDLGNERAST